MSREEILQLEEAVRENHLLMVEKATEVASLRKILEELWSDGSVRAAVGEGSALYARIEAVISAHETTHGGTDDR